MINPADMTREDWWLLKGPLLALVAALGLIVAVLIVTSQLDTRATTELRAARTQLDTARADVEKIAEEEQAILANIGLFQELTADAAIQPEDRLLFLEEIAQLRAEYSLFPINVSIDEQHLLPLQYPQSAREPGRTIELHVSTVNLELSLLHEDDFARLLAALLTAPGVIQPQQCSLSARSAPGTNYIYLAQHFSAACSLLWYSIITPPDTTETP